MKPLIAIVGRPNVGKSALFNRLIRQRMALVEDLAGTTRDRLYADCDIWGKTCTLIDTGGMQVRFAGSSADVEGNLVDGDIRARDGALLRLRDNLSTPIALLYAGYHAQRGLFAGADGLDLRWKHAAPRRKDAPTLTPDLCGVARPAAPTYGAFEDIGACSQPK